MIYTLAFNGPWPILQLEAGHFVAVNSQVPYPLNVLACRPIPPNYGALLGALEEGVAEIIDPRLSVADLAAAVGWLGTPARPRPPSAPRPRPGAHLVRLK